MEEWVKLYNSGKSFREIGVIVNRPTTTVWRKIKDKVIVRKSIDYVDRYTKYKIDNNIFNNIDTRDKSYILGILLADGHSYKNNHQIRLKLQERDKSILEKIKVVLDYEKPLNLSELQNKRHQNQYSLIICNKQITLDLERHGVIKNKTFNMITPKTDDNLFIDLFRGYFDGDGWFYSDKNNKGGTLGIIGEINFITFIKDKLKELYGIIGYFSYDKRGDDRIISLRIRKREYITKLYGMMYENTDLYIERKHNKIKKYLYDIL